MTEIRRGRAPSGPVEMPDIKIPPAEPETLRLLEEDDSESRLTATTTGRNGNGSIEIGVSMYLEDDYTIELTKEQALDLADFLQWHGGGRW